MTPEELRRLRNTAWTETGYLYWQRGDPDSVKREIWEFVESKRLDGDTRSIIEKVGPPDAFATREVRK